MKRGVLLLVAASAFLAAAGVEGGGKSAWKPFLPDGAYKELTARSIKFIRDTASAGDKNAAEKIEVEAAIIAAYTLSALDPKERTGLRARALAAAQAARAGNIKHLSKFTTELDVPPLTGEIKDFRVFLQATEPMMKMFLSKAKGGEGIHPDLHYQVKLKNLNGIEALLSSLAGKKLNEENMGKVSKELTLLGYRLAAVGAITHELTPKKDADNWREMSITMRDESIRLAESADRKNAEGVLKAATALENSCIDCHSAFKNK